MIDIKTEILISGGTGQIGCRLVEILIEMGINPIVMSRDINRSEIIKKYYQKSKLRFVSADLSADEDDIKNALKTLQPQVLIHLGSVVDQRMDFFDSCRQVISVNINGTMNLLKCLPQIKMICFPSTTSLYGAPKYLPIDERHPTNPTNTYSASKLCVEKYLQLYSAQKKIPVAILRIASGYSALRYAPQLKRAIPDFLRSALYETDIEIWGEGTEKRDFIYIDDIVTAIILAVGKKIDGVFNIASGQSSCVKDAAEIIKNLLNNKISIKYKSVDAELWPDYAFDIQRAITKMGFVPKHDLKEGLSLCLEAQKLK